MIINGEVTMKYTLKIALLCGIMGLPVSSLYSASATVKVKQPTFEEVEFFFKAGSSGDLKIVQEMIALYPAIVHSTAMWNTPVSDQIMGYNPSVGIVGELIKAGACIDRVDHYGNTHLRDAARHSNLDIVKLLLQAGASPKKRRKEKDAFRQQRIHTLGRDRSPNSGLAAIAEFNAREEAEDNQIEEVYNFVINGINTERKALVVTCLHEDLSQQEWPSDIAQLVADFAAIPFCSEESEKE